MTLRISRTKEGRVEGVGVCDVGLSADSQKHNLVRCTRDREQEKERGEERRERERERMWERLFKWKSIFSFNFSQG